MNDISTAVVKRLEMLGYTVKDADSAAIEFNISKAELSLKAQANLEAVPDGLFYVFVDMAAGMFLLDQKSTGALSDLFSFDAPAKSISEGDTSVTFAIADTGSTEDQFDTMIDKMIHPDAEIIVAFRRLTW